jgi:hypothetical protein
MKKLIPLVFSCLLFSCYSENEEDLFPVTDYNKITDPRTDTIPDTTSGTLEVSYSMDVSPIITGNCARCHDGSNSFIPGIWTNYSDIKARVDNGKFNRKVLDPGFDMPKDDPALLVDSDRDILRRWVAEGAKNN